jgi:hypothetical protein
MSIDPGRAIPMIRLCKAPLPAAKVNMQLLSFSIPACEKSIARKIEKD